MTRQPGGGASLEAVQCPCFICVLCLGTVIPCWPAHAARQAAASTCSGLTSCVAADVESAVVPGASKDNVGSQQELKPLSSEADPAVTEGDIASDDVDAASCQPAGRLLASLVRPAVLCCSKGAYTKHA